MSSISTGGGSSIPPQTGEVASTAQTSPQISQKEGDTGKGVTGSKIQDTALSYLKSKAQTQNLTEKANSQQEALNSTSENKPKLDAYSPSMAATPFSDKTLESLSTFFNGTSSKAAVPDEMAFLPGEDGDISSQSAAAASTSTSTNSAAFYLSGTGGWMVAISKASLDSQREQRESTSTMNKLVSDAQNSSRELTFDSYDQQMDAAQKEMVVSVVTSSTEMLAGGISIGGSLISVGQQKTNSPKELKEMDGKINELNSQIKTYDGSPDKPESSQYLKDRATIDSPKTDDATMQEKALAQKRLDKRSEQQRELGDVSYKKDSLERKVLETNNTSATVMNGLATGLSSVVSAGGKLSTAYTEKKSKEARAMADLEKQSKNVEDQTSQQLQKAMQAALEMSGSSNQLMLSVGQTRQSAAR